MKKKTCGGGHLFLVHGDLTRLACDAWLLPTDRRRNVGPHWYQDEVGPDWRPATPDTAWTSGATRVERVVNWRDDAPRPWLANVGRKSADAQWYVKAVVQFLQMASESHERYLTGRAKKLVALPVVGTGAGGGYAIAGDILEVLLPTLYDAAARLDLDVALVMRDAAVYAAAVQTRRRLQAQFDVWHSLQPTERATADRLAKRAGDGDLVVFFGAGASRGANLPTWNELLDRLLIGTEATSEISDETLAAFRQLPPLDQARWLELRLARAADPGAGGLGEAVRKLLTPFRHPSLCHALLAALPVREFVTTNYDTLFERAAQGTEQPLRVIPYAPGGDSRRWLLKMHGCVEHPADIVLTRGDFLRYDDQRSALRGIVQAMLMTKHMLFVGFSLNDDNFHRIAEDVRKSLRGSGRGDAGKKHAIRHHAVARTRDISPGTVVERPGLARTRSISRRPGPSGAAAGGLSRLPSRRVRASSAASLRSSLRFGVDDGRARTASHAGPVAAGIESRRK